MTSLKIVLNHILLAMSALRNVVSRIVSAKTSSMNVSSQTAQARTEGSRSGWVKTSLRIAESHIEEGTIVGMNVERMVGSRNVLGMFVERVAGNGSQGGRQLIFRHVHRTYTNSCLVYNDLVCCATSCSPS